MISKDIRTFFSFIKPSNIKGWFDVENLFVNYFWFFSICALFVQIFNKSSLFNIGFPIILYIMVLRKYRAISFNLIDYLWFIDLFIIFLSWQINDYPHKSFLLIKACCQELVYMMTYWIVRCNKYEYLQVIITRASKPLIIGCVVGLFCFIFEPAWYKASIERTIENTYGTTNIGVSSVLEQMRLRSFYNGPYVLAYFTSIALTYEFFLFFRNKNVKNDKYRILYILLLVVTCVFCMMRAPIVCTIIGLVLAFTYSFCYCDRKRGIIQILYIFVTVGIFFIFVLSFMDFSTIEFMYDKVDVLTSKDENFVSQRFYSQGISYSLFGDGYGRYNATAVKFGLTTVPDGEYMKILSEQGYIGLFVTLFMFVIGFFKSVTNFKKLYFECCLIIMLFICMIGADPLSTSDKHCLLYWMALGQISRYRCYKTVSTQKCSEAI